MERPGVGVVFEVGAEALVDHTLPQGVLQHRKRDFDAPEEVAVHPIGTGEEDSIIAVVQEVKDSTMFEKPADDRPHSDMFRQSRDTGP